MSAREQFAEVLAAHRSFGWDGEHGHRCRCGQMLSENAVTDAERLWVTHVADALAAALPDPEQAEATPLGDHPHVDPGDGRAECYLCGKFVHDVIHSCKGVPVTRAAEARVRALIDAVRAGVKPYREPDPEQAVRGRCICNTGPGTDGPDETCPQHGRTLEDWIERGDILTARVDDLRAKVARVEALVVVPRHVAEHDCFKPWCPSCSERKTYESFVRGIRAALDGA